MQNEEVIKNQILWGDRTHLACLNQGGCRIVTSVLLGSGDVLRSGKVNLSLVDRFRHLLTYFYNLLKNSVVLY